MNAAIENARRLAGAASLLLEHCDYALAASLAALSIEEAGKLTILRSLAVARDDQEVLECWREYRSHTKKNVMWPFMDLLAKGARRLDDFAPLFDPDGGHPFLLDQVKQIGFYSDCLGQAHWSIPGSAIDEDLAKMLVATAHILTESQTVTPTEIDLWIKHMGPVWKASKEQMQSAIVKWYEAMQAQALMEKGPNAMEDFVLRGVQGFRQATAPGEGSQGKTDVDEPDTENEEASSATCHPPPAAGL